MTQPPGSMPALSDATTDDVVAADAPGDGGFTLPDGGPRYERRGLVGVGGMGQVHVAYDRLLRREVALKEATTPALAARLAREARVTAQLEHPGIVAVHDAGQGPDGRPWYSMRLVRGRTLASCLAACRSLDERLALVPHLHAACQAVASAHAVGVVHRDLKPLNIMVGQFGETQVVDWGLAGPVPAAEEDWRHIAPGLNRRPEGTSRYMSPEQAAGGPATFGADVWSLGRTLEELLGAPDQAPPELVAIARHATQPRVDDRYQTAAELADDLGRWLAGRRVHAHVYGSGELFLRLVSAWRAPLAVAAVALVLVAAAVASGSHRAATERRIADQHLVQALTQQAVAALLDDRRPAAEVLAASALRVGPSPLARGVLAATAGPRPTRLSTEPLPPACRRTALPSPDGSLLACFSADRVALWSVAPLAERWTVDQDLTAWPTWDRGLLVQGEGELRRRSLETGEVLEHWPADAPLDLHPGPLGTLPGLLVDFTAPDGPQTRPLCLGQRATTTVLGGRVVAVCNGRLSIAPLDGGPALDRELDANVGWSGIWPDRSDGRALVGTFGGDLLALDLETGEDAPLLSGFGSAIVDVLPVAGTPYVVVLGERGLARIGHPAVGAWVGAFPGDVDRLAPGPAPGELRLLGEHLETWRLPPDLRPSEIALGSGVSQVAVSPDGQRVAYALGTGEVGVRRAVDGAPIQRWQWQQAVAKAVAFSDDGALVASAMDGGWRRLAADGTVEAVTEHRSTLRRMGRLGDGVWGLSYGRGIRLIARDTVTQVEGSFYEGSSSPDGSLAVLLGEDGGAWRLDDGGLTRIAVGQDLVAADISDDGARVALATRQRVCIDDRCVEPGDAIYDLALDERFLAVGTLGGTIHLFDAADLSTRAILPGHSARVSTLELSPGWLVSGSWDGSLRFWDLARLDAPGDDLLADRTAAWGLDTQQALGGPG